jgi:hypothetical protein
VYVAQGNPRPDAEIAEKGHFGMGTREDVAGGGAH